MTVLTKNKKRLPRRPRCEDSTTNGDLCLFRGSRYVDGKWICARHADKRSRREQSTGSLT